MSYRDYAREKAGLPPLKCRERETKPEQLRRVKREVKEAQRKHQEQNEPATP